VAAAFNLLESENPMTRCLTRTKLAVAVWLLAISAAISSTPSSATPADEVLAAMDRWAETYASATSPEPMLALYTPDAVFWGTSARAPFVGPAAFAPYFKLQFDNYTDRKVTFVHPEIRIYGDGAFATSTGTYQFDVTLPGGQRAEVENRYSFALVKVDGNWLIAQHHSSAMPQP
jgi:uncharacterized protein (TIGR02246 family)